jgi:hypothetical protein
MCVARGDVEDPVTPLQPHEVSDSLISNVHVQERPVSPSSRIEQDAREIFRPRT